MGIRHLYYCDLCQTKTDEARRASLPAGWAVITLGGTFGTTMTKELDLDEFGKITMCPQCKAGFIDNLKTSKELGVVLT